MYQGVSPSPFLTQGPKQTLKNKLCTEHLSQSVPQILEYGRHPIQKSFLGSLPSTLFGQAKFFLNLGSMILLQRLAPNSPSLRVLQTSGVWLKIPHRSQGTIFLQKENKFEYNIHLWLLICWIIQTD